MYIILYIDRAATGHLCSHHCTPIKISSVQKILDVLIIFLSFIYKYR